MPRVFLSHSTDDKPFVEEVATALGRARAQIDSHVFKPGEDFRDAIRRALRESEAFVFFVSPRSLASSWVKFELDEAEFRRMRGFLRRSLAIFIDDPIDPSALPDWLARFRAVRHVLPAQSARTIEGVLASVAPDLQPPFIGRHDDMQRGVRKLSSTDPPARLLVVSGLNGIGRRSYLGRLVRDALNLDLGPVITLPSTATLEDVFLESHLSATMLTREEADKEIAAFRALSQDEQSREVAKQLILYAKDGNAPCIVDRGAMLDSTGKYFPEFARLLADYLNERDVYLCIVHSRAPNYREAPFRSFVMERRLRPLPLPDAQALVARLLRDAQIAVSRDQTVRLAEATNGYPPAAYYLVTQIEDYGLDVVLNDESRIADFSTRSFARFLRDLKLTAAEREVLIYLSSETSLSLPGIAAATGRSISKTSAIVRQLIDLSIVELEDGDYAVSGPIQDTVLRNEDGLGRRWYEKAFARLEAEYWSDERSLPPISVVDATLRAGFRIGWHRAEGFGSLVRPSLLINAAQEMYHRREYERALEYLDRAEALGGSTAQLLEIRIKSSAQLRRFRDAKEALRAYREFRERRQWYLEGFVSRKAGDHAEACGKFQRGYARKDRSLSLLRDYADSLFRTDALDASAAIAGEALTRDPGNIYILDLIARIEIAGGRKEDAEKALDNLERADVDCRFILHRRASYLLYRRGTGEAVRRAVTLAERAVASGSAPVEAYMVLARALIRAGNWKRVDEVKAAISKRKREDTRGAIRAIDIDAAIRRGEWRLAERLMPETLKTEDERELALDILELKSVDTTVMLAERQEAKADAERRRSRRGDRIRRPPMDRDLYE